MKIYANPLTHSTIARDGPFDQQPRKAQESRSERPLQMFPPCQKVSGQINWYQAVPAISIRTHPRFLFSRQSTPRQNEQNEVRRCLLRTPAGVVCFHFFHFYGCRCSAAYHLLCLPAEICVTNRKHANSSVGSKKWAQKFFVFLFFGII